MPQYIYRVWKARFGTNEIDHDHLPKIITDTRTALTYGDSDDYIIERAELGEFERVCVQFITEEMGEEND